MGVPPLPRPAIVRWPGQESLRRACAALGTPCLLVLDAGVAAPALSPNEDVVRRDDGERDAAARLAQVVRRAAERRSSPIPAFDADEPRSEDRAVRRLVGLLRARPERLVPWLDLAAPGADRGRVARQAATALVAAGWWVEVLDHVGVLAGPVREVVG